MDTSSLLCAVRNVFNSEKLGLNTFLIHIRRASYSEQPLHLLTSWSVVCKKEICTEERLHWTPGAKFETEIPQATRAVFTQGSIKQSPEGVQRPHKSRTDQWPVLGRRTTAKQQLPHVGASLILREFSITKTRSALKTGIKEAVCEKGPRTQHWQHWLLGSLHTAFW